MKRVILMFLAMFGLVSCTSSQNTYKQMSMNDAMDLMENESDYVILDVRTLEEYNEKHILGAMNIPNESIGTEEIDALPDKEQLIFVYCRSGNRSRQASEKLVELGYTNIIEMGGIGDWSGEFE